MQVYHRVDHLYKNRIFLNLSPHCLGHSQDFWSFSNMWQGPAQRLNFFCRKAIRRGTELSGNFYSSRKKKFQIKNFHSPQFLEALSSLNFFLRFSEVGVYTFNFPGLVNIRKKRQLKFSPLEETVTVRGIGKC